MALATVCFTVALSTSPSPAALRTAMLRLRGEMDERCDLALAPLAGDARPSEDDARPTFQWTTSKRARKRRPFSRGDVGFRCWAPVEIGAGNG